MLQKHSIILVTAILLVMATLLLGVLLWGLFSSGIFSLSPTPTLPTVHPGWTSYTNTDNVSGIDFDLEGNLWVASTGGVLKWNIENRSYVKFTVDNGLPARNPTSVATAPDSTVWVGTYGGGIARFDGQAWRTYPGQNSLSYIGHIAAAPDNTVWASMDNYSVWPNYGIWYFDGQTGTLFLEGGPGQETVKSIAVTADGVAWLGTYEGLWSYDGQDWTHYTDKDGLASKAVLSLAAAPDGTLWVGTTEGVVSFDGENWETHTETNSLSGYQIFHIDASSGGYVWAYGEYTDYSGCIVTELENLARFDGQTWTIHERDETLRGASINALVSASNGGVWVGTSKGVWFFDGQEWQQYVETNTPPSLILADVAVGSDGTVWVAGGGISSFDGKTWTNYPYSGPIAIAPDGTVWAHKEKGLASLDGHEWRVHKDQAAITHGITAMATAPDNTVWVVLWAVGIGHFDGETWTVYTPDDSLPGDCEYIRDIAVDADGVVWAGFEKATQKCKGGLTRFDGEEWTLYTGENGWTSNTVNSIAVASDGDLWVATLRGGISRFDGHTWHSYDVVSELAPWLAGDISAELATGPDGAVWAGVSDTALHFDGQQWTAYGTEDGLVDRTIRAVAVGPQGEVWFATNGGLSRYELSLDTGLSDPDVR